MSEFDEIQRLLRLKCYESPGPNYVDETLRQFHRRQAAALIHRPLWKLALDRFHVHVQPALTSPHFATVTAFGLVLLSTALFLMPRLTPAGKPSAHKVVASSANAVAQETMVRLETPSLTEPLPISAQSSQTFSPRTAATPDLEFVWLLSKGNLTIKSPEPGEVVTARQTDTPRYVIDAQPVSYEACISF